MKNLLILIITIILISGCTADIRSEKPDALIKELIRELETKENIVFLINSTVIKNDKIATLNLKGVQFVSKEQIYYLGHSFGSRLELFKDEKELYMKTDENQWIKVDTGGGKELKSIINDPLTLLRYGEYGELQFLNNNIRKNRGKEIILTGRLGEKGSKFYLENHLPELLEDFDFEQCLVELTFYIDPKKRSLTRVDVFINELSGQFSLVTEILLTNYNVVTDIIPPQTN